jgi:hypothetical protein
MQEEGEAEGPVMIPTRIGGDALPAIEHGGTLSLTFPGVRVTFGQ